MCNQLKINRCNGGTYCFHLQARRIYQARNQRKTGRMKSFDVTSCIVADVHRGYRGTCSLHLQDRKSIIHKNFYLLGYNASLNETQMDKYNSGHHKLNIYLPILFHPVTVAERSLHSLGSRDGGSESQRRHRCLVCVCVYSVFMLSCETAPVV
jgi:hypothetical protein